MNPIRANCQRLRVKRDFRIWPEADPAGGVGGAC